MCLLSIDELVCQIYLIISAVCTVPVPTAINAPCSQQGFTTSHHSLHLIATLAALTSMNIHDKGAFKCNHTHERVRRTSHVLVWVPSHTNCSSASESSVKDSSASAYSHFSHRAKTQPLEAADLNHLSSHLLSTDLHNLRLCSWKCGSIRILKINTNKMCLHPYCVQNQPWISTWEMWVPSGDHKLLCPPTLPSPFPNILF